MKHKNSTLRVSILLLVLINVLGYFHLAQAQTEGCPSDMTHYWKLDETASPYIDFYGGSNATCTNCPVSTTGIINGAQQFTSNTQVNVADDNTFDWNATDSFSIEFWMKTDPASTCSGNQVIVGRDDSATNLHWWVGCLNGGKTVFQLNDTSGDGASVVGIKDLTDGAWHHVVAIRDASMNENRIYVDGVKENWTSKTYSVGFDSSVSLNIGWLNLATGYHFVGTIDEAALYNRALTDTEIISHYYLSRGYCDLCATPVRIMPLGDSITTGNNTTIIDNNYMASYRQKLYLDLISLGYSVDFVGSLQSGAYLNPPFDIDHEGHPGYMAAGPYGEGEVVNEVYNWLSVNPAEIVLLHIGTNDVANDGESADEIAAILDEIDRYSKNITVLLARIINQKPYNPEVTNYNNDVESMAQTRIASGDKVIIVDIENALTYPDDMAGWLHPTQTGYDKMALPWFNALNSFLPICADYAPLIASTPNTLAALGKTYTYDVNAIGNPVPTYNFVTAPSEMNLDPVNGLIEWIPATVGTFEVTVDATNSVGVDTQSFTLQVIECPSDMTHYWKLDETASPYIDFYGGSNATCTNCPVSTTGIINGAQLFDGINDAVNLTDDDTFDWTKDDSFSIEFWMKTDSASTCSGNQVIVGRDDSATNLHWWVGCLNGGQTAFQLNDTSGDSAGIVGIKDLTDGAWHHVVAVRDASMNENRIYVDGAIENWTSKTYSVGFDSSVSLNIGWLNLATGYHFVGAVDEVALYSGILSASEVLEHFNNGISGNGYCYTTYTVTPSVVGSGSINPSTPQTVNQGLTTSFTVTPDSGYHTVSVTGCGGTWTGTNPYTTGPITTDCTVTATFAINTYTVTPSAGANGSINPSTPQTVNHGSTTAFTVTPNTGYHTESVTGCGGTWTGTNPYTTGPITANCTVTATFAINTYTVTPSAGANGSINPSTPQTVNHGSTTAFTIIPDDGYYIDSVTGCGGTLDGNTYTTAPITADCEVIATFAAYTAINLLEPNGGEIIPSGSSDFDIHWEAPPEAVKFKLKLSLDNGLTWSLIADDIPDRSYGWTAPIPWGNKKQCLIKIVGYDDSNVKVGVDESNETFTIEVVGVTSPNGGEILTPGGAPWLIEWTTGVTRRTVEKVRLYYTKDGGTSWTRIVTLPENPGDPVNPGSYSWEVPMVGKDKGKCKVKVELRDASGNVLGQDVSDDYFTIEGPVEVTSPNGGETITPGGAPWLIEWTTGVTRGTVEKVRLYYTKDGGTSWTRIVTLPENPGDPVNPGSYDWTVPAVVKPKTECKVRVELVDASANVLGEDASDEYFTIQP